MIWFNALIIVTAAVVLVGALSPFLLRWSVRRSRRTALREAIGELYLYNRVDGCWDPIGSIDAMGMEILVEVISQGKLGRKSVLSPRKINEIKRVWRAARTVQ